MTTRGVLVGKPPVAPGPALPVGKLCEGSGPQYNTSNARATDIAIRWLWAGTSTHWQEGWVDAEFVTRS